MKIWLAIFSVSVLAFIIACSNGDDALFDTDDSKDISISAKMTVNLDSIHLQTKSDTIRTTDTMTFIAEIMPSRSIRMQRYYWTLDGETWAYEFSFRNSIPEPGHHVVALVLIDFFGDTLTDTLNVWVGNPPFLNEKSIIPQPETQGIPPEEGVSFSWSAYDPDSLYGLHYRFRLTSRSRETLLDTVLDNPYLTYRLPLSPLETYYWEVEAYNEIGMASPTSITGKFYTKGVEEESGINGNIEISGNRNSSEQVNVVIQFQDSTGKIAATDTVIGYTANKLSYTAKPLKAGSYKVIASIPDYPDYKPDTITVQLRPSEIYTIEEQYLIDMTAPIVKSAGAGSDTLDFADTLKFCIKDYGSQFESISLRAFLEDSPLDTDVIKITEDSMAIFLPSSAKSIGMRLLVISATDPSGNKVDKTFYIKPTLYWFECNNDTTLYTNDILELYIRDTNPYGFEPDSFYFDIIKNNPVIAISAEKSISLKVMYTTFPDSVNHVRTGLRYKNGLVQWRNWTVNRIFATRSKNE
ncbi:hypothetical protein [Fibrobacter sp. UBA4309]|uniref:hypothetical protein n=1 Tax=Fibrobacter sp. UBA4309 TaxID=1946537 RepID=UPI0025BD30E4|nr:hypothetical protein [Fibrobacter sp. UBA4309]